MKKVEYYVFVKDWEGNGVKVYAGVTLKGEFRVTSDCVSLIGSEVFSGILLEYLEKKEPVQYKRSMKRKKQNFEAKTKPKTQSESARISDRRV